MSLEEFFYQYSVQWLHTELGWNKIVSAHALSFLHAEWGRVDVEKVMDMWKAVS